MNLDPKPMHMAMPNRKMAESVSLEKYNELVTENFVPLDIKLDVELFEQQMFGNEHLFKHWGPKDKHPHMFRKGIALVNADGRMDPDEWDACVGPLDVWNRRHNVSSFDPDYTVHTPALNWSCFDPLEPLKPYMQRSAIIWFNTGSFFYPHIDQFAPFENIRLWGTNKPDGYLFTFLDGTTHTNRKIEPGRLYLVDTSKLHYPEAFEDDVFTFFISVSPQSYDILKSMVIKDDM